MTPSRLYVGVDAGGTKIRAAVADLRGGRVVVTEGPGANAALAGPDTAAAAIAAALAPALAGRRPAGICVGIAGAWNRGLAATIERRLRAATGARRVRVLNDAVAALMGSVRPGERALLLSVGTGAVLVGVGGARKPIRVDGWGPLAGDAGGGHWIGRRAIELALEQHDGRRPEDGFGRTVRRALELRDPGDHIHRLYGDGALPPASVVPLVLRLARRGNPTARRLLRSAGEELARTVRAAARAAGGSARLLVTGGLAQAAPEVLSAVRALAAASRGRLRLDPRRPVPHAACLALCGGLAGDPRVERRLAEAAETARTIRPRRLRPAASAVPATEQDDPATADFSRLSPLAMVRMMNREDARVAPAVGAILPAAGRAVRMAERALRRGGRLIYVGAGTSGRLGVLDASEVPPTFGVPPGTVVGLHAGGARALRASVEGAEDDARAGAGGIRRLRVSSRDLVVGLSVSGGARFVLGAVAEARRRGAATVGITCNSGSALARAVGLPLVARVGPEVVAGSSRLKAGTAQKMLLNMLSTCAFARLGRVQGNLMTHVVPANEKLEDRAVRIAARLLRIPAGEARRRLTRANWRLDRALEEIPGRRRG